VSVKVWSLVWSAPPIGNRTAKLVLLRLADRAHDDGTEARPGVESLARDCDLSPRHTQRLLRWLEGSGFIKVDRAASQHRPRIYSINLAKLRGDMGDTSDPRRTGGTHVTSGRSSGATSKASGDDTSVTSEGPRGDTDVTQTVLQNYNRPEENRHIPPLPPQGGDVVIPNHQQLFRERMGEEVQEERGALAPYHGDGVKVALDNHRRLFLERTGYPYNPLKGAKDRNGRATGPSDLMRLQPLVNLYGLERLLELQSGFFEATEGWWVEKKAWTVAVFVSAINDVVAQQAPGLPPGQESRPVVSKLMRRNLAAIRRVLGDEA